MRKALAVLVLATLMVSAMGPGEGQEEEEGEEIILKETRITDDNEHQDLPTIFANKIIWKDHGNQTVGIWVYNEKNLTSWKISETGIWPHIYGEKIVWADGRNIPSTNLLNIDIYMFDLTLNQEFRITSDENSQNIPKVYENKIVYINTTELNSDISFYDVNSNKEYPICTNNFKQTDPDIWGDWIVWNDYRNNNWDIFAYNIITKEERAIATGPEIQGVPHIYGEQVIFVQLLVNSTHKQGYLYNFTTNSTELILDGIGSIADVWGDYVIWVGQGGISVYVISLDKSYKLTSESIDDIAIYENKVVVVRNGDIYLLEFTFPEPPQTSEPSFWEQNRMPIGLGITIIIFAIILVFLLRGKKRGKTDGNILKVE